MARVVLPWSDVVAFECELPLPAEARSRVAHWLPERWKSAVPKRQDQSLAARFCALEAAKIGGWELQELPIDDRGAPLWPEGLVGSLAHTDTHAIAVLALMKPGRGLGIDIESWMNVDKLSSVEETIATPSELRGLPQDPLQRARSLTRIFSAKEAFYKALHPYVQGHIDFNEVELINNQYLRVISERSELSAWRSEYPVVFIESTAHLTSIILF